MVDYRISDLVASLRRGELSRRAFLKRSSAVGLTAAAAASILRGEAFAAPAGGRSSFGRNQIDDSMLVIADNLSGGGYWLSLDPGWYFEINPTCAMYVVYETLYHLPDSTKPDEILPLLAEGMPEFSDDGLTATIAIKQGVKFHNSGTEMTAKDWVFSWNRLKHIGAQPSFLGSDYWTEVVAVDDYTLQLTLPSPNAALAAVLTAVPLSVTDSEAVIALGGTDAEPSAEEDAPEVQANADARDQINQSSVGTGPYQVTQWDINSEVIVEINPEYWGEAPVIERIIWRNVIEANAQLQSVQIGEADIAYSLGVDSVPTVREDETLQIIEGPSLSIQYIGFNLREERGGPVSSVEVRQALSYAVDYNGILEQMLGGSAVRPATAVPIGFAAADEVLHLAYVEDLARAQELWDASGVGEQEIEITYDADGIGEGGVNLETLATKVKADLERINGCTIKLAPMPSAERLAAYRAQDFQATISPWSPDYPDVDTFATPFGQTDTAAAGRVGFSDPEVDEWLRQGISETDPAARTQIYVQVQERLIEAAPYIVLYQPVAQKAARAIVQGVTTHAVYMMNLRNASKSA
ncbi:MAG: ABC transporter substrate-binding protein [Thermomicrobiales bacterium]|jgi:peptide/nickel transport system substrate-binding protein|nr:ABC transporter substrate-binding protein [Thermomicrobiales bacterium]